MPSERVFLPNGRGQQLGARVDVPERRRSAALFAPCFTCGKNARAAYKVCRELARHGYAALRLDFTGLGESEGDFSTMTFETHVADLLAAARWMEAQHEPPQLLIGHSLGGIVALFAALQLPAVRAVALIGSPRHPGHVLRRLEGREEELRREGFAEVEIAGHRVRLGREFADSIAAVEMEQMWRSLQAAVLVCHSPDDEGVPYSHGEELFAAAPQPKAFVSIPGADHLLLRNKADAPWLARVIAAWARRHVLAQSPAGGG